MRLLETKLLANSQSEMLTKKRQNPLHQQLKITKLKSHHQPSYLNKESKKWLQSHVGTKIHPHLNRLCPHRHPIDETHRLKARASTSRKKQSIILMMSKTKWLTVILQKKKRISSQKQLIKEGSETACVTQCSLAPRSWSHFSSNRLQRSRRNESESLPLTACRSRKVSLNTS